MKVSDYEYDLVLQNDINTNGHTQWFFFRVANTRVGHRVRLNIINLSKPESLYNNGMRVLSYSEKKKEMGWHRVGQDIRYYQNNFDKGRKKYYTLTFVHLFDTNDD